MYKYCQIRLPTDTKREEYNMKDMRTRIESSLTSHIAPYITNTPTFPCSTPTTASFTSSLKSKHIKNNLPRHSKVTKHGRRGAKFARSQHPTNKFQNKTRAEIRVSASNLSRRPIYKGKAIKCKKIKRRTPPKIIRRTVSIPKGKPIRKSPKIIRSRMSPLPNIEKPTISNNHKVPSWIRKICPLCQSDASVSSICSTPLPSSISTIDSNFCVTDSESDSVSEKNIPTFSPWSLYGSNRVDLKTKMDNTRRLHSKNNILYIPTRASKTIDYRIYDS